MPWELPYRVRRLELCIPPPLLLLDSLGLHIQPSQLGVWDGRCHLYRSPSSTSSVCSSPSLLDVQMCGNLRWVGQRHLCLAVNVLLVAHWRGETKNASHSIMMLMPLLSWSYFIQRINSMNNGKSFLFSHLWSTGNFVRFFSMRWNTLLIESDFPPRGYFTWPLIITFGKPWNIDNMVAENGF